MKYVLHTLDLYGNVFGKPFFLKISKKRCFTCNSFLTDETTLTEMSFTDDTCFDDNQFIPFVK